MNNIQQQNIIANWLLLGVVMLVVQVLLGGVTRLTGSGLSITEWDPIMGILPPLNDAQWQETFDSYKDIAQYKYINYNFTLGDFKLIFFWEWFHRLWARLMGMVFLIPFLYFLIKGYFKKGMILPLILLFILGGMQGLIGWLMVSTGINTENIYVTHFSLATHFMAAMLLIGYTFIFALRLRISKEQKISNSHLRRLALIITIALAVQLIYGAFMAGLKAAIASPTWPAINGSFIPAGLFKNGFIESALHNVITIQFIHRILAYLITALIIFWWFKARKIITSTAFTKLKNWPLILVITQVLLGIFAVLTSIHIVHGQFGIFEWLAEAHQLTGMLLFLSMLAVLYLLRPSEA
jgi:cytochrome c oxidase assembly protein subunit 15